MPAKSRSILPVDVTAIPVIILFMATSVSALNSALGSSARLGAPAATRITANVAAADPNCERRDLWRFSLAIGTGWVCFTRRKARESIDTPHLVELQLQMGHDA